MEGFTESAMNLGNFQKVAEPKSQETEVPLPRADQGQSPGGEGLRNKLRSPPETEEKFEISVQVSTLCRRKVRV